MLCPICEQEASNFHDVWYQRRVAEACGNCVKNLKLDYTKPYDRNGRPTKAMIEAYHGKAKRKEPENQESFLNQFKKKIAF